MVEVRGLLEGQELVGGRWQLQLPAVGSLHTASAVCLGVREGGREWLERLCEAQRGDGTCAAWKTVLGLGGGLGRAWGLGGGLGRTCAAWRTASWGLHLEETGG